MTRDELITEAAGNAGMSKVAIHVALKELLRAITRNLNLGNEIVIHGFGKFSTKNTAARTGRNPITGAAVDIPAKRKVVFKPQKMLKEAVQE